MNAFKTDKIKYKPHRDNIHRFINKSIHTFVAPSSSASIAGGRSRNGNHGCADQRKFLSSQRYTLICGRKASRREGPRPPSPRHRGPRHMSVLLDPQREALCHWATWLHYSSIRVMLNIWWSDDSGAVVVAIDLTKQTVSCGVQKRA